MSQQSPISLGAVIGESAPDADTVMEKIVLTVQSRKFVIENPRHMTLFIFHALKKGFPITFVREFCFYAVNLLKVQQVIVVPAISSCTFIEISNRNSSRFRSACVVAHMTHIQTCMPKSLAASIKLLIKSLHEQGGDIETAEIQLFGGDSELDTNGSINYKVERANIVKEIESYCKVNELNKPKIVEPRNHWCKKLPAGQSWKESFDKGTGETWDYVLTRFGIWYRRADMDQDPASDIVSCDSPKGTSPGRRELFCRVMDHPENQTSTSKTMLQTTYLREIWKQRGVSSIPQILPVNQSGLIRR